MNVMRYMRLGDSVRKRSRQPRHNGSQVSQKAPVVRRQCASWKGELPRTIVWEEGVGVLEKSDQDDPVIDPVGGKSFQG